MSRRGENIYKRKDGRWEGRYIRAYNENGKAIYGSVYGQTYSKAKQKLAEKREIIAKRLPTAPQDGSIKYADVLRDWLQSMKIGIKASTYAKYAHMITSHISPWLGQYAIGQIRTQLIEAFIQEKLSHGRIDGLGGLSPKTVTDMVAVIKASFRYAKRRGMIVTCDTNSLSIRQNEREMRVLTRAEQAALVQFLLDGLDLYKFGVLLCLYTGIRIGELCALTWENLSLSNATLKIRKTMQRIQNQSGDSGAKTKVIITEPKSKCSIRDIPLPLFLVKLAKQFERNSRAFVLSSDPNRFVEPRTMQNRFKSYVTAVGLADVNFHATRHTFATRCVELGFDTKTLSEILGHASVNITLNRYVHSSFELKAQNMSKLTLLP